MFALILSIVAGADTGSVISCADKRAHKYANYGNTESNERAHERSDFSSSAV